MKKCLFALLGFSVLLLSCHPPTQIVPEQTVSDPVSGVSVFIPEGALDDSLAITVTGYSTPQSMADQHGLNTFVAGVTLGPDGTTFNKPVTVTVPLSHLLVPDTEYDVYYKIATSDGDKWTPVESPGRTNADGTSIKFQTTHFSDFGTTEWYGRSLGRYGGFFAQYLDGSKAGAKFTSEFCSSNCGPELMSIKRTEGGIEYRVIGAFFDIRYKLNGQEGQFIKQVGKSTGKRETLVDSFDLTTTDNLAVWYEVQITIYWQPRVAGFDSIFLCGGFPADPADVYGIPRPATIFTTKITLPDSAPSDSEGTYYLSKEPDANVPVTGWDMFQTDLGNWLLPFLFPGYKVTIDFIDWRHDANTGIPCSETWMIFVPN